ncbi:MAG: hypothetical protein AVDCRST_MAG93-6162, partial [uncultured Chloroflexia bacterium]
MLNVPPAPPTEVPYTVRTAQRITVASRLVAASLISLGLFLFVGGTGWDVQWHAAIGRDRVLTAPHILMLSGIVLIGLASLSAILLDTLRAARGSGVNNQNSSHFLGMFRSSAGFFLAGFGALLSTLAFPLDEYWHVLYGIDVTLWAPFHVMIAGGMISAGFGTMYAFTAEGNREAGRLRAIAHVGFLVAAALTLSTLYLLLPDSGCEHGVINVGSVSVGMYPALASLSTTFFLFIAACTFNRPGGALGVDVVVEALRWGLVAFVPWAVEVTRLAEGFTYRPNPPVVVITPLWFPNSILLITVIIEAVRWFARAQPSSQNWGVLASATAITALVFISERTWLSQVS